MASIENRSRYQVSVKNRDDLTKTFAHSSKTKAEEYCQSLGKQKLKSKLSRLDDNYIVRIRTRGGDQVLHANSLKEAGLVKAKLKVEHSQGLFIDYSKAQNTTFADLLIRYLWEVAPRNKSFEIEAYKINAMLQDAGLPRQSVREIVEAHPNPCDEVKTMTFRKQTGIKLASLCSATAFILKPFAAILPEHFTEYVDERCQDVAGATVDRELDIFSAVCTAAIKKWRIHVWQSPMEGVTRPEYFNERDRRLKKGEEERLLIAASKEDEKASLTLRLDELVSSELSDVDEIPTRYRRRQARQSNLQEADATYVHVPWYETLIQFQLMTGARRSETLNLLWSNVDLDEKTAYLPKTKNGRPRKLPLRDDLVEMLSQLPRIGERVFNITPDALRKAWGRICENASLVGINNLHVHDLRHEAISRVAEAGSNTPGGFSLIDLQHFSGHRDVRMLLRYAHLCTRSLAQRLDAAFKTDKHFTIHHGRKRLTNAAPIQVEDFDDEAVKQRDMNSAEDGTPVQMASGLHPFPKENVVHVDFGRKRA